MRSISLTQYLVEKQREKNLIPGELRLLLEVVARACKKISIAVNKGALGNVLGEAGTENCCCSIRSTVRPTSTSTSRSAPFSRCCG